MNFTQMIMKYSDPASADIDIFIQRQFLTQHWPQFSTSVRNGILVVEGHWTSSCYYYKYDFLVGYDPNRALTFSFIVKPIIEPNKYIHINLDRTLCLYNASQYPLNKKFLLATEIIPWTIEWTLWYERYLVNGFKWEGPE